MIEEMCTADEQLTIHAAAGGTSSQNRVANVQHDELPKWMLVVKASRMRRSTIVRLVFLPFLYSHRADIGEECDKRFLAFVDAIEVALVWQILIICLLHVR